MPPANDNFANATSISGEFGWSGGNNIGATSETGEPLNNGATVWFKWTSPDISTFVFQTTPQNYPTAVTLPSNPVLKTVLRIYTGTSVSSLTEVTYIQPAFNSRYANWDYGSKVMFAAAAGTVYYIRIDGMMINTLTAMSVASGGKGYVVGDVLTVNSGDAVAGTATVTSVSGSGAVTGVSLTTGGDYSVYPSNPAPVSGGTGNKATLNVTFGQAVDQGNFSLAWQLFFPDDIGGCASCPPMIGAICVGVITPDVTLGTGTYWMGSGTPGVTPLKGQNYSFGASLPAGVYLIKWCAGAYATPPWVVFYNDIMGDLGEGFVVEYNDATNSGTRTDKWILPTYCANNASGITPPSNQYGAEQETGSLLLNGGNLDCGLQFSHSGGDISMFLVDADFGDNTSGSPSPTFGLYQITSELQVVCCATWSTVGSIISCTFKIINAYPISYTGVTATVLSGSGISSPSGPNTINIPSNSSVSTTFTFNCTSLKSTVALQLSGGGLASTQTFSLYMAPIFVSANGSGGSCVENTIGGFQDPVGTYPCTHSTYVVWRENFMNVGFGKCVSTLMDISLSNGALLLNPSGCGFVSSLTGIQLSNGSGTSINCHAFDSSSCVNSWATESVFAGSLDAGIGIQKPALPLSCTATIRIYDAIDTYAVLTIPIVVPNT